MLVNILMTARQVQAGAGRVCAGAIGQQRAAGCSHRLLDILVVLRHCGCLSGSSHPAVLRGACTPQLSGNRIQFGAPVSVIINAAMAGTSHPRGICHQRRVSCYFCARVWPRADDPCLGAHRYRDAHPRILRRFRLTLLSALLPGVASGGFGAGHELTPVAAVHFQPLPPGVPDTWAPQYGEPQ